MKNTSVFVLCGGRGTRLGTKTSETPKPLVCVNGRPMLQHILDNFVKQGFREITLGTGHLSSKIEDFARRYRDSAEVRISNAGPDVSMLARIARAVDGFQDTTIVAYGDTFIDIDYADLVRTHLDSEALITMVTGKIRNPFGIVRLESSKVVYFVEKPVYDYYIGCFVFRKDLRSRISEELSGLPDGQGIVRLFQKLIAAGAVRAYPHEGLQVTFNTEPELEEAQRAISQYYTVRE